MRSPANGAVVLADAGLPGRDDANEAYTAMLARRTRAERAA
jgi:hypothetical protein